MVFKIIAKKRNVTLVFCCKYDYSDFFFSKYDTFKIRNIFVNQKYNALANLPVNVQQDLKHI